MLRRCRGSDTPPFSPPSEALQPLHPTVCIRPSLWLHTHNPNTHTHTTTTHWNKHSSWKRRPSGLGYSSTTFKARCLQVPPHLHGKAFLPRLSTTTPTSQSQGTQGLCRRPYDNGLVGSALLSVPGVRSHFTDWETRDFPRATGSRLISCSLLSSQCFSLLLSLKALRKFLTS